MPTAVDRRQVLAYRAAAQGLHRDSAAVDDLAVLDLGVQDTPPGSAATALAARMAAPDDAASPRLTTTWTVRGAPHVHRADDLVGLSRALWPTSDADALARLDTSASPVRSAGTPARQTLRFVAEQIADIVSEPMPKGEISRALTPRVPEPLTVDCRVCEGTHIVETLFRCAMLPAGMRFATGTRAVTFTPVAGWPGVPEEARGTAALAATYLGLHGPATLRDVAAFLGTRPGELDDVRPEGLAEVVLDGQRRWLPADRLEALRDPPDPPAVRLLPPSDPWLQARDRALTVPEPDRRKAVWPTLGRPGVLLAAGEVAATWRARKRGRRLDVTVEPFARLAAATRRGLDAEADRLARVRGMGGVALAVG